MASTVSSTTLIRTTVSALAQYLFNELNNNTSSLTESGLEDILTTFVSTTQSNDLPASSIVPDFEANASELETLLLSQDDPAWTIQLITSTGSQILQMIASVQTMNQLGVELALREAFIQLAQLKSSIYASTIDMGIRIARKSSAYCNVSLTSTDNTVIIPPYTQFSIGGISYFNRDSISFVNSSTVTCTLYQGAVETTSFTSDGTALQSFYFGNSDFAVANDDITVTVGGLKWTRAEYVAFYSVGLWEYSSTDTVYTEGTTPDGNAIIQFGSGINGVIPTADTIIEITYVLTTGSDGNVNLTNQTVSCSSYTSVTGTATSASINGSNERDPEEYKIISPGMYSAKLKPSTENDYSAFALNYPGVLDAYFLGQQDFAPKDTSKCMYVQGNLLVNSSWTADTTTAFVNWLTGKYNGIKYAGANLQFLINLATAVAVDITINIYCYNTANYSTVKTNVQSAINALFTPGAGYLGKGMAESDVSRAIDSVEQTDIDYYDIIMQDTWPEPNQYLTIGNLVINVNGSSRRNS